MIRPVKNISKIDNSRIEKIGNFEVIKRDSIEPEPIGTIILKAFRIIGYDKDCDGSLMARLENIDKNGEITGWECRAIDLYPESTLVIDKNDLKKLFKDYPQTIPRLSPGENRRLKSLDRHGFKT